MIIFNNLGHTYKEKNDEPLVWFDASDTSSFFVPPSTSQLLALKNKGILGGLLTENNGIYGNVRYENGGFESWTISDFIQFDLNEPFMPSNSFTISLTLNFTDNTSGVNPITQYPANIYADDSNYVSYYTNGATQFNQPYSLAGGSGVSFSYMNPYSFGLMTFVFSYDVNTNEVIMLKADGTFNTQSGIVFDNNDDLTIYLLNNHLTSRNLGVNNTFYEFRLYPSAFDSTQMQDLQTQLNEKYTP